MTWMRTRYYWSSVLETEYQQFSADLPNFATSEGCPTNVHLTAITATVVTRFSFQTTLQHTVCLLRLKRLIPNTSYIVYVHNYPGQHRSSATILSASRLFFPVIYPSLKEEHCQEAV